MPSILACLFRTPTLSLSFPFSVTVIRAINIPSLYLSSFLRFFRYSMAAVTTASEAPNGITTDVRSTFLQVYHRLKSELLDDPTFDFTDDSRLWIERVRKSYSSLTFLTRSLPLSSVGSYRLPIL